MKLSASIQLSSRVVLTANRLRLITLVIGSILAGLAIVLEYHSPEFWAFLGILVTTLSSQPR